LVEVRPGYARNYLLPRELAVPASKANIRDWQKRIETARVREAEARALATERADQVRDQRVFIVRKPAEGSTRLHGSVTTHDIRDAIAEQHGIELDRRDVDLSSSIRSLGDFSGRVKLYRGMTVPIRIHVVEAMPTAEEIEAMDQVPEEPAAEEAEAAEAADEAPAEETAEAPPPAE